MTTDDSVQPVKPTLGVTDVLSEFRPGQRLVAEIQAQLPNGTYRALVAQRDVTLSLPFSAKAGDSLELEVVDTNGRLTFAIAAKPGDGAALPAGRESTTTLSLTAQLISTLLPKAAEGKGNAPPAPLNAGQPVVPTPPKAGGSEFAPLLQKAVATSGLFYESHQAAWIAGRLTQAALLLEPQGRLPPTLQPMPLARDVASPPAGGTATASGTPPGAGQPIATTVRTSLGGNATQTATVVSPTTSSIANSPSAPAGATVDSRNQAAVSDSGATGRAVANAPPSLAADSAPLVQQQLNALATNVYAWHGLAWPGQTIDWEIVDEDARRHGSNEDGVEPQWQTQLRLALPSLGSVDAVLRLRGQQVSVALVARREAARDTLAAGGEALRNQFEAAGLQLTSLGVTVGETTRVAADEIR